MAVTAAELLLGVELADDQHPAGRQRVVEAVLHVSVADYDLAVACAHARLLAGVPRRTAWRT